MHLIHHNVDIIHFAELKVSTTKQCYNNMIYDNKNEDKDGSAKKKSNSISQIHWSMKEFRHLTACNNLCIA